MNIGRYVNKRKICGEDETYQQDKKNQNKLTVRFIELDLPEHDRMIINIYIYIYIYIACLQTVDCRYADISYVVGIEDSITFLKGEMDLINRK